MFRNNILLFPDGKDAGGVANIEGNNKQPGASEGSLVEGNNDNKADTNEGGSGEAFDFDELKGDDSSSTPAPQKSIATQSDEDILTDKQDQRQVKPVSTNVGKGKPVSTNVKVDQQQQAKDDKNKRDYSKFTQEDVEYAKTLPNHIFSAIAPILEKKAILEQQYKETQETLKKEQEANKNPNRIPDSWYDHEEAFTLSPEYKEINSMYSRADFEAKHWEQQLINIEQGKPWSALDYKDGQYFAGQTYQPKPEDKFSVQRAYNEAIKIMDKQQSAAERLAVDFKSKMSSNASHYSDKSNVEIKKLMPELQPKDEHTKMFVDKFILPAHKNHPLAKLAASLYSIILNQGTMLGGLLEKDKKGRQIAADRLAAGPTSRTGVSGASGKNGNGNVIDFDDLKQDMEGE